MKRYKAVVIGAGNIAKTHMKTLFQHDKTEVTAVADIDMERATDLANHYNVNAYADYQMMVREEKPDIAVITLPHDLHKNSAIWCIEQGCHVLLEKPMALNAKECEAILQAARKHHAIVAVGHMQHYFPVNRKAREILQSGQLGELVMIVDRRHYPYFLPERPDWFLHKSRSGGGVVINLGSHSIDKIQWLSGSYVKNVKASLTHFGKRGDVEGSANLFMELESGVSASVSLCGYDNVPINETELLFTGGSLKLEGMSKLLMSQGEYRTYQEINISEIPKPFADQWEDMLEAVEYGKKIEIIGEYGKTVTAVVDAIYRSYETGKEEMVKANLEKLEFYK